MGNFARLKNNTLVWTRVNPEENFWEYEMVLGKILGQPEEACLKILYFPGLDWALKRGWVCYWKVPGLLTIT